MPVAVSKHNNNNKDEKETPWMYLHTIAAITALLWTKLAQFKKDTTVIVSIIACTNRYVSNLLPDYSRSLFLGCAEPLFTYINLELKGHNVRYRLTILVAMKRSRMHRMDCLLSLWACWSLGESNRDPDVNSGGTQTFDQLLYPRHDVCTSLST